MDTSKMNSNLQELKDDKGVVLVEMYASWCPHCQRMMPVVADVKAMMAGKANVYQFDVDKFKELADQLQVQSIPTFIIYKDGEEQWRQSGEMPGQELVNALESVINGN